MNDPLLFVTGATGFIGRRFLTKVTVDGSFRVRCLSRKTTSADMGRRVELAMGDLREPASYLDALDGCEMVVHLAATTGKARPADYFAVNDQGTRALLEACHRTGVQRIIFASSIATTYRDKTAYHYAWSRQQAERAVQDSGLDYAIVRPTIVLGEGSPIGERLVALAGLPITPLFGDGSVRVQPIHVDDVATFLASIVQDRPLPNRAINLGGPDVLTFEDLIRRIRRLVRGSDSPIVHLPARRTIALLAWMERWLPPLLPITAGQLAAFVNDSIAVSELPAGRDVPPMKTIDEMLRLLVSHG